MAKDSKIEKADGSTEVTSGLHKISIPNYKKLNDTAKIARRKNKEQMGSNFRKSDPLQKDVTQAFGGAEMAASEKVEKKELHPAFKANMGKIHEIMAARRNVAKSETSPDSFNKYTTRGNHDPGVDTKTKAAPNNAVVKAESIGIQPKNTNTEAYDKSYNESYKRSMKNGGSSAHAHGNAKAYAHSLHGPRGSDIKAKMEKADMSTPTAGAPTSRPDTGFGKVIMKSQSDTGHTVEYITTKEE